jgi:hypothetical protein
MDSLQYLQTLGERFHGITLDFRRGGTDWPAAWRVRLVSTKNEREEYRVECFGDTAEQAVDSLRAEVSSLDGVGKV